MTRKVSLVLLILLTVAAPVNGALAQWSQGPYCGDLDAESCAILQSSHAASQELWSAAYEMEMTMDIAADDERFSLGFNSAGVVGYDKEDMDALKNEVLDMTIREALALLKAPEALGDRFLGYMDRILLAPAAEMGFEMTLPPEAMGIAGDESPRLMARIMVVDGVVYFSSPLLDAVMMGEGSTTQETWLSLDLFEVKDMIVATLEGPEFTARMDAMRESLLEGEFAMPAQRDVPQFQKILGRLIVFMGAGYWEEFQSPEFLASVLTIERLEDAEIAGTPVAVFETTFDYGALVENETFKAYLQDYAALFAFDDEEMLMEEMMPAITEMMKGMTMTYTQAIGLEDYQTYALSMTYAFEIDPAAFAEAMGERPGDIEVGGMSESFTMLLTLSDHNQPLDIVPPEDSISVLALFQ